MKIAIQGHPTRGKEVIQILESLGSKNGYDQSGSNEDFVYFINSVGLIYSVALQMCSNERRIYTLEEFEKEFPFKVGDKIITIDGTIGIIDEFKPEEDYPYCIRADDGIFYWHVTFTLKPYKEMKEERNLKLTLDKAKEWYKKGGELKEIALQAFTEKELNPLPRSWNEFCRKYKFACLSTRYSNFPLKYDALFKLEQLRDCWRQGWEPMTHEAIYAIKFSVHGLDVYNFVSREFLSFPTREMAEEFLKCFRDLIEQAGDLI